MDETTETDLKKRDLLKTLPLAPAMLLGGEFARGEAHINGIEGFSGLRQEPPGQVPRHEQARFLSAPERVRVQVQSSA